MKQQRGWLAAIVLGISVGCDQELVLPQGPSPEQEAAGAPASGITGASGAGDESTPPDRLPVPNGPIFTTFGGAGGDGQGGEAGDASGVAGAGNPGGGSGGASAPSLGAGGDAAGASGAEMPAQPRVLFFSEYLEGTGSLKALEIYSAEAASLEGCELRTYFNGKLEPARLALHGALPRGGMQVLCSSALAAAQPSLCDRSTNLTFNGDDALALACEGVLLDVIGQIGLDPGSAWGDGATADHTLRRRCQVAAGRQDGSVAFDPASQWSTLGPDVFDDLGVRDCVN